jgi:hypothetical protein
MCVTKHIYDKIQNKSGTRTDVHIIVEYLFIIIYVIS